MKRIAFLRRLRELIPVYGSKNIVYIDETGFRKEAYRPHGWAVRGQKVYGNISGNNRKSINLIMAQRGQEFLAPETFQETCTAHKVNDWLKRKLMPVLSQKSIIVMDNASFHKKKDIAAIVEKSGHVFLPLPPYSPDFNPIEKSFGVLKRRRSFEPNISIQKLLNIQDS
jgi:putative transposase